MNAAQLIEALKTLPPEIEVWYDYFDDCRDKSYRSPITGVGSDGEIRDWEVV